MQKMAAWQISRRMDSLQKRVCMGIEPPAESPENNTLLVECGAKPGAPTGRTASIDPALAAVIDAWPKLPEAIRAAILALLRAADGQRT
jgi:hypothetical protein